MKCTLFNDSLTNSHTKACLECPSAASFAAKETWSDEITKVPNEDAWLDVDGKKCPPSENRAIVLER